MIVGLVGWIGSGKNTVANILTEKHNFNPDSYVTYEQVANSKRPAPFMLYKNLDNMHNHPTVKYTPAAINKNIIALDGMQMLGFGPRTIETALYLSKKFQTIENN